MTKTYTSAAKAKIMASENPDYLTPKEQAFVENYLANNGNGRQAAILAGYAENSAAVTASKLLTKDKIKKRLEAKQRETSERLGLDRDWIVSRLMKEADAADSDAARIRALELLGKVEDIFAAEKKKIDANVNSDGTFLASLDLSDDEGDEIAH